jgi:hypothetical protein
MNADALWQCVNDQWQGWGDRDGLGLPDLSAEYPSHPGAGATSVLLREYLKGCPEPKAA